MNGMGSFPAKPNIYDYNTGLEHSLADEITSSEYYEEIPAADPNSHQSTSTDDSSKKVVSGKGKCDVIRDSQVALYESIDDAMINVYACSNLQGGVNYTDNDTYDDVMEVTSHGATTNGPQHTTLDPSRANPTSSCEDTHEPFNLMTAEDETILIDNCIYEETTQEWQ